MLVCVWLEERDKKHKVRRKSQIKASLVEQDTHSLVKVRGLYWLLTRET